MRKTILILALILSVTVSLKAQTLFNTFKHDTVLVSPPKNEVISKTDLYETALSFFKSYKKDKEIINFNSLPLYKHEADTSRYQDGSNKLNLLAQSNGYVNATFTDESNKRYNIGVSCYDNKYIYYVTSDAGVSQSAITSKISYLKEFMSHTKASTPVIQQTLNTLQTQSNSTVAPTTTSTHESTNCGSTQCSGTTQKGGRCKRMTTSCSGRCYQH